MTGFGKATVAYKEKKINVEVKSLNSKTLDLSTRIAPLYREKEMEIRQFIAKNLERGKIDFSIWIEKDVVADATPINMAICCAIRPSFRAPHCRWWCPRSVSSGPRNCLPLPQPA